MMTIISSLNSRKKVIDYFTSFLQPWEQMVSHSVYPDDVVWPKTSVHISKTTNEVAHLSISSIRYCSGWILEGLNICRWSCARCSLPFSDIQNTIVEGDI